MMPAPPALSAQPQFTPGHWDRVPREKTKTKITRITKIDDEFTEFVFEGGSAFQRRTEDLNPEVNLHVNLQAYVETIGGELVTGMWIPEQGWAFRMTSQDLADYAKNLSAMIHKQRQAAREELKDYIADAIKAGLGEQVDVEDVDGLVLISGPVDLNTLARFLMDAMEATKSAGQR